MTEQLVDSHLKVEINAKYPEKLKREMQLVMKLLVKPDGGNDVAISHPFVYNLFCGDI